jgi:hypothetical protein
MQWIGLQNVGQFKGWRRILKNVYTQKKWPDSKINFLWPIKVSPFHTGSQGPPFICERIARRQQLFAGQCTNRQDTQSLEIHSTYAAEP